jgi:hypothetical protein
MAGRRRVARNIRLHGVKLNGGNYPPRRSQWSVARLPN